MAIGFSGTVAEFLDLSSRGEFGGRISTARVGTGGCPLAPEEEQVWTGDARVLAEFFKRSEVSTRGTYMMVAEYDIPGHLGRCDLVLLGADRHGGKQGCIIELKRWTNFEEGPIPEYVLVGGSLHLHPSYQALQYADTIDFFHAKGREYEWHAGAWMTVMPAARATALNSLAPPKAPVWGLRNADATPRSILGEWMQGGLAESEFLAFRDARCSPDARLAEALLERLPGLTKGLHAAVGGQPIDLSARQEEVVEAILHEVGRDGRVLILVSGRPGCGKTVVGVNAIAHHLGRSIDAVSRRIRGRAVLALRNNRLCTVIRSAIDEAVGRRVGKALVQYVRGGGPGVGIVAQVPEDQDAPRPYDLVVVDEAHRVPDDAGPGRHGLSQLSAVLSAGRAVVCLLDEGQILNEDDNGTSETYRGRWKQLCPSGRIVDLALDEQHRVPPAYAAWLDAFLSGASNAPPPGYDIRVVQRPAEVVDYLREKGNHHDCGLLASYTVCNGRRGQTLRVPSLGIHWLMDPKDYSVWWRDRARRHRFDRCASVYGCQGFELDYAGVFWGRDLFVRRGARGVVFEIADPHDIKDDIQLAHGRKLTRMAEAAIRTRDEALRCDVVRRLLNRYRILLSRGRMGTVIHCEDPETAAVLQGLVGSERG